MIPVIVASSNSRATPLKSVRQAIKVSVTESLWPTEERQAINMVWSLRKNYLSNNLRVEIIDFGAGGSREHRSEELQNKGVLIKKSIRSLCRVNSIKPSYSRLLFQMVRMLQPHSILELGSCIGISALTMASAQRLNGSGDTTTIEGAPGLYRVMEQHLSNEQYPNLKLINGRFQDVLPEVLPRLAPLDLVMIDGHHDEKATLTYFQMLLPQLSPNAILIFDDIHWSKGMTRAWKQIRQHPAVGGWLDLYQWGICSVS